jgi:Glycosyl transferase family 2
MMKRNEMAGFGCNPSKPSFVDYPQVNVVIPTYNRAGLVRRALRSVLAQSYQNLTVSVYDNASTDATQSVIRELAEKDSRIECYRNETNVGAVRNGLRALRSVRTPFFLFLSDDDVIFPEFLADAMGWFGRYTEAAFVAGGTLETTQKGALVTFNQSYWPREGYFTPPSGLDLIAAGLHPHWTTTVFRTEMLNVVGEPNTDMPNTLDWDFLLRIACRLPFVVFRKPSGIFVRHRSAGGEQQTASVISQYEMMMRNFGSDLTLDAGVRAMIKKRLNEQLAKRMCAVAAKQLLRGQAESASETVQAYHLGHRKTVASMLLGWIAVAGSVCPPLLRILRPAECLRRLVRAQLSRIAARRNGIPMTEVGEGLTLLRSST